MNLKPFKRDDERSGLTWLFRIASIVAILAVLAAIGWSMRKGHSTPAILLVVTVPLLAVAFSRSWTGFLFTAIESARRYVQGAEGGHRHEWYAFKGQRVRVFVDEMRRPWFALDEIAHILDLKVDKTTFSNYGLQEYGVPESASGPCLSESGLRRLIKYSAHPDAGVLGLWLEREVLRSLRQRRGHL